MSEPFFVEKLRSFGLTVSEIIDPNAAYVIALDIDDPETIRAMYPGSIPLEKIKDEASVYLHEGSWRFRHWTGMPGPGPEDFDCEFSTLEAAGKAAVAFYGGRPTPINEWLVPLHRHPAWSEQEVRDALARTSVQMSSVEFKLMARLNVIRTLTRADLYTVQAVWQCTYIPCPHQSDPNLVLQLRRDLKDHYIVVAE
jgi:hypothetical protein